MNNLPAEELFVLSFEPGITPPLVPTPPDNDVIFDPGKVVLALLGLPEFPRSCRKKRIRLGNSGYKGSWKSEGAHLYWALFPSNKGGWGQITFYPS